MNWLLFAFIFVNIIVYCVYLFIWTDGVLEHELSSCAVVM
jgi:hypothetical protein